MTPDSWPPDSWPADHPSEEGHEEGRTAFDPLADLLLGLIAIVVPIVGLLLASERGAPAGAGTQEPASAFPAQVDAAVVVVASAAGVRISETDADARAYRVPRDRILDDGLLAERLRAYRDAGAPVLLRIEADGLESAFLFDAVAARHGPAAIRQLRTSAEGPPSPPKTHGTHGAHGAKGAQGGER